MRLQGSLRRGAVLAAIALVAAPVFATASGAVAHPAVAPPNSPTNVSVSSGNRSLAVSWAESSGGTINFVATATAAGKPSKVCRTKSTSCSIVALANGTLYTVTVTAKNGGGVSATSNAQTSVVGVPGAPLSVHATAGVAMATISWAPPKASGVANVTSYHATASPGGFSCSSSGTLLTSPARTCQIAGLQSGTTYTITVTATNSFGTGTPSKPSTVTPS